MLVISLHTYIYSSVVNRYVSYSVHIYIYIISSVVNSYICTHKLHVGHYQWKIMPFAVQNALYLYTYNEETS